VGGSQGRKSSSSPILDQCMTPRLGGFDLVHMDKGTFIVDPVDMQ
jgi:hypothetical protein